MENHNIYKILTKMKKILFFIMLLPVVLFAQNDSVYKNAVKYVDNIIITNQLNEKDLLKHDSLFFEATLNYVETFKNDSDYYKIRKAVEIVKNFSFYPYLPSILQFYKNPLSDTIFNVHKTLKIRTKSVNFLLDVYNYPSVWNRPSFKTDLWRFKSDAFNVEAKQKITFILSGNISQNDYNRQALYKQKLYPSYEDNIEWLGTKRDILKREIKKTSKADFVVKDSLFKVWQKNDLANFKLKIYYPLELLHVIGRTYFYEFVPQIEAMTDTSVGFPNYFAKLVLARLGVEPYLSDFFNNVKELEYIPNFNKYQIESIDVFKLWINTKYYYIEPALSYGSGGSSAYKSISGGYFVSYYVANIIEKFPTEYKIKYPSRSSYKVNAIDFTKTWLKENEENIVLNNIFYYEPLPFEFNYMDLTSNEFIEMYKKAIDYANKFID